MLKRCESGAPTVAGTGAKLGQQQGQTRRLQVEVQEGLEQEHLGCKRRRLAGEQEGLEQEHLGWRRRHLVGEQEGLEHFQVSEK